MKRNLLTLLMMLALQSIVAQTTIVCNAEGELPQLLSEKAQGVTELAISGAVSAEDIRAINNYPKIELLDLTGARLPVIPEKAWDNLHSLTQLYLPKAIDTLYLDAISCNKYNKNWIDIYLSGKFPHLKNYPIPVETAPFYQWIVAEGNDMLVVEIDENDAQIGGGIFSADKKILYKALSLDYSLSGFIDYNVEKVWDCAFSQLFAADFAYIILHEVKEISNSAFCDFSYAVTIDGKIDKRYGLYVSLDTELPPKKVGEGNLNHNVPCKDILRFRVSDIDLYIQDDPSWAELNLEDPNGIRWGTKVENISTNDKTPSTPYYDLMGRPVANPTRGIYIKDGKKIAVD